MEGPRSIHEARCVKLGQSGQSTVEIMAGRTLTLYDLGSVKVAAQISMQPCTGLQARVGDMDQRKIDWGHSTATHPSGSCAGDAVIARAATIPSSCDRCHR